MDIGLIAQLLNEENVFTRKVDTSIEEDSKSLKRKS